MNKTGIKKLRTEKLIDLSAFAKNWTAPYVERQQLKEFSGGALNARTMANLDSKGKGIKGRKILCPVYEVVASLPKKGWVGQGGGRV